jgi:hypothetical protein
LAEAVSSRRLLIAKWAEWIGLGLLPVLSAIKTVGAPVPPTTLLQMLYHEVVEAYVGLVFGASVLALAGKAGQAILGAESKARVKAVLNALEDSCFNTVAPGERYFNRVTIFKAVWFGTKLKAYCRAGDRYQRDISSFKISNDDEAKNEGLAGQAWFRNATVIVGDLPECPNPWTDANARCQDYAHRGLLTAKKAGQLKVKSRSILATPVRNFKGNQWGVLVLDSRQPDAFGAERQASVTSVATVLSKML